MKATENKHREVIRVLIGKGANVNFQDASGATSLMWATAGGDAELAQILLVAGANVNLKNKGGYTALMIAEFNQYSICCANAQAIWCTRLIWIWV